MTIEVKKEPFSLDWKGTVLEMSKDDKVVRRYDFSLVDSKLDTDFLQLGRKTKLGNFKASAKKLGRDPIEMMDEGFELLKSGEWEFEREGIVRAPLHLIKLVAELLTISEIDAEASLKSQKDTWAEIEKAHAPRVAAIKKELATAKDSAAKNVRDLSKLVAKK